MAQEHGTGGTWLVVLQGDITDASTVRLACQLAQRRGATLRAVYVVVVPPAQPLGAWHGAADEAGRAALAAASELAAAIGCPLRGAVLPTRDMGQAIVDEAAEWAAAMIVLALGDSPRQQAVSWHVVREAVSSVLMWRAAPDGSMPDTHGGRHGMETATPEDDHGARPS